MKYPWMPLFWGDFLAKTMDLSAHEAGAYLFLIAHAWQNGGRIPGEPVRLARIAHVRSDQWKRTWQVLQKFFDPDPGDSRIVGYYHQRVLDELHRVGQISSKRKEAALQKHSKSRAVSKVNGHASTSTTIEERSSAKGSEAQTNFRDKGVDYRSPPRSKSDNVLQALPEKGGHR